MRRDNEFDMRRDNERAGIRIENISSPKLQTASDVRDQRTRMTGGLPNGNSPTGLVQDEGEIAFDAMDKISQISTGPRLVPSGSHGQEDEWRRRPPTMPSPGKWLAGVGSTPHHVDDNKQDRATETSRAGERYVWEGNGLELVQQARLFCCRGTESYTTTVHNINKSSTTKNNPFACE